jgi:hypothetical protein
MNRKHHYPLCCITLLLSSASFQAVHADSRIKDWQERRLMQPSVDELQWEQAGNVMIYDGLTDSQVSAAMDKHFDRIESMMFTGVIITGNDGEPLEDPLTGHFIAENDGC